jgi:transcription elongation factor GreB
LEELIIVDRTPDNTSKIYFGAWVEVEDADGNVYQYRIVGPDETDPEKNYISVDSPMAKALLRKAEGDEIVVNRPNGAAAFVILSIHY